MLLRLVPIAVLASCTPHASPAPARTPRTPAPAAEPGETLYRVHLATGVVTAIDSAHAVPLDGPVEARIDGERLRVRRGDRVIVDRDALGAFSVAWQIRRDDMLYVSLFRNESQTYEALRLGHDDVLWSRVVMNDRPGETHGAFVTTSGPVIVHTTYSIAAIRTNDGSTAWSVPWPDDGTPAKVLEAGANLVACGRDVVALDRETGRERWRRRSQNGEISDCTLVGRQVLVGTRLCGKDCTAKDNFALDVDTGSVLYTRAEPFGRVLAEIDRDRALIEIARAGAVPGGVAVLDARTGTVSAPLALAGFLSAERLPEGDVLVHGKQTTRLAVEPLSIRWQARDAYDQRVGHFLVGSRSNVPAGKSVVVLIDVASGVEREVDLPTIKPPGEFPWELGGAFIVGTSPTDVDLAVRFGHLG